VSAVIYVVAILASEAGLEYMEAENLDEVLRSERVGMSYHKLHF
jgi:hypothetical protein